VPSFDVVSEVNAHEVTNAVNQANREIETRFDFKGTNARFELDDDRVTMRAPDKFQLNQMYDVLTTRLVSRKVNIRCLERESFQTNLSDARQVVRVRQGIEAELARQIVKMVKQSKLKVQVAIQGAKLRLSGKKRDDLQQAISLIKEADFEMPLQFNNYRD
jgi:hypothetical protein